jgi:hypothetical protein
MPSVRIPLIGSYNQRPSIRLGSSTNYDQRFRNVLFDLVENKAAGVVTAYASKRPGLALRRAVSAGNGATAIHKILGGPGKVLLAFGTSNSTIFYAGDSSDTNCGTITGLCFNISEAYIGSELYYLFTSSDNTGWYLPDNAATDATPTFTADTTNTNAVLTNVSSTTNVYVGQALSGTGIAAGARVQSIDSATQITMTLAATATNATQTITFTRIAKIIDSDFPSDINGAFVTIDGWTFIVDPTTRRIYNSDLNSVTSWDASNYITFGENADVPAALAKYGNRLLCLGRSSSELYENVGNPAASPLRKVKAFNVGCLSASSKPIAYCGDAIYWVGGESGQGSHVYTIKDFSPVQISSPSMARQIGRDLGSYFVSSFVLNGVKYVLLSENASPYRHFLGSESSPFAECDFPTNTVAIVSGGNVNTLTNGADNQGVYAVLYNDTGGYSINGRSPVYTDNASSFSMIIQMARQDFGTGNRKFLKSIELVADTQASGTTTLEISKDDFATWTTIGTFDMTKAKKIIHRCGSFVGGASLRLTHSANTAWRGEALIVEYDVGAH